MEYNKLKYHINDSKVAIIADESTIIQNKSALCVLIKKLDLNCNKPFLTNTVYLSAVNNETVAKAVVETVSHLDISFNNVLAFNSNNVKFMQNAYNDHMRVLFPDSRHIGCYAHIFALLGTAWRIELKLLDSFIASVKSFFSKASHLRDRYIDFLLQKGKTDFFHFFCFFRCCKSHFISKPCGYKVEYMVHGVLLFE